MLRVVPVEELLRPTRNKKRILESSDEWLQLRARLAEGIKPHEAVLITFTEADRSKLGMKTLGRVFLKMTKAYIAQLRLPYDVYRYHSEGKEVVTIEGRAISGRASVKAEPVAQPTHHAASKKRVASR